MYVERIQKMSLSRDEKEIQTEPAMLAPLGANATSEIDGGEVSKECRQATVKESS